MPESVRLTIELEGPLRQDPIFEYIQQNVNYIFRTHVLDSDNGVTTFSWNDRIRDTIYEYVEYICSSITTSEAIEDFWDVDVENLYNYRYGATYDLSLIHI